MAGTAGGEIGRDRRGDSSHLIRVGRFALGVALFLPLALPAPVVATGWSQLLSTLSGLGIGANASMAGRLIAGMSRGLLDGPWALLLAWVGRWTPLAFALLALGLRQTPREWIEAARLEGAGPLERMRIVEWPVMRRPALAAVAFIFCLSLGEVGASILLLPPGTTSLGVRLMTLMHYAPTATVSALALSSVVLGLAAGTLVFVVSRPGKKATVGL